MPDGRDDVDRTYVRPVPRSAAPLAIALALVALLACAGPAPAAWRAPVDGPIMGRFRVGVDPFAAGQRRGIDFAARPGAPVRAPCSGRVAFAGALPRLGAGVSIRCGALTATVLGLAAARLRAGGVVGAGDRLGDAGARGRVRLGARRTPERFGYVDPERLLGAAVPVLAPGRPGAARRPGRGPGGPVPRPAPVRAPATRPGVVPARAARLAPARAPRSVADRAPRPAPLAAWIGAALAAGSLASGTALRARRRRRARGGRAETVAG